MSYRFLKISSYYKSILTDYYSKNPSIKAMNYDEQHAHLMKQRIGLSDFYSNHLTSKGVIANEIVANATYLQNSWDTTFSETQNSKEVIINQIEFYKPDVLFLQDSYLLNGQQIRELRKKFKFIKLIVGYSCSPFHDTTIENFKAFDLIITCTDQFKNSFEAHGIKCHTIHHGFETSIVEEVTGGDELKKLYDIIFIGSIMPGKGFHQTRLEIIEQLLDKNIQLKIFGQLYEESGSKILAAQSAFLFAELLRRSGFKKAPFNSAFLKKAYDILSYPENLKYSNALRKSVSEMVYGIDMYKQLAHSRIGFNIHGDIAQTTANMRIFETTGMGACLLTDHKSDIADFFEPDEEIVTFNTSNECVDKISWLLKNPVKLSEIALNGQIRCHKDHSMKSRVDIFHKVVTTHLGK